MVPLSKATYPHKVRMVCRWKAGCHSLLAGSFFLFLGTLPLSGEPVFGKYRVILNVVLALVSLIVAWPIAIVLSRRRARSLGLVCPHCNHTLASTLVSGPEYVQRTGMCQYCGERVLCDGG